MYFSLSCRYGLLTRFGQFCAEYGNMLRYAEYVPNRPNTRPLSKLKTTELDGIQCIFSQFHMPQWIEAVLIID